MFKKNIFKVIKLDQARLWSLDEVKNYLRVSHDYDDAIIKSLIVSAVDSAENYLGISLHLRKIEFTCNLSGRRVFQLKFNPVTQISQVIKTLNERERQLDKNDYSYDAEYCVLYLKQSLSGEELRVTYVAGHENINIPYAIKQGILHHICAMYDRDSDNTLSMRDEVKNLYHPYKKIRL